MRMEREDNTAVMGSQRTLLPPTADEKALCNITPETVIQKVYYTSMTESLALLFEVTKYCQLEKVGYLYRTRSEPTDGTL